MGEGAQKFDGAPAELEAPFDELVEEAVIGTILARPDLADNLGPVSDDMFMLPAYARIWRLAEAMQRAKQTVSVTTMAGALQRIEREAKIEADSLSHLNELAILAPSTPTAVRAAGQKLRELYARRCIMGVHQSAMFDAADPQEGENAADLIGRAMEALTAILPGAVTNPVVDLEATAEAVLRRASNPQAGQRDAIYFGVKEIDARLGGLMPGDFIVIAGRPGMGKSLMANRLKRSVCEQGLGCADFELEMSAEDTSARLLCDMARDRGSEVHYSSVRRSEVRPAYVPVLAQCASELIRWGLLIDERPGLKISDIRARGRQCKAELARRGMRLALIVVDHIGLVRPDADRRGNKVAEMTDVSNAMKEMAKELGCVVCGVSQLSRAVENRDDKRPQLSDLRESGSIEQDADVVLLLYREAYYLKQKEAVMASADFHAEMDACRHVLEVNAAKVRSGEPGFNVCAVDAATASIRDGGAFD